jgi:Peroxidase
VIAKTQVPLVESARIFATQKIGIPIHHTTVDVLQLPSVKTKMWSTTTAASLFWLAGFATTVTEAFVPLSSRHSASWKMTSTTTPLFAVSEATLSGAQAMIDGIIDEKNCNPVFVRLAWHDSGTHDASITDPWPAAGGAIGSIRFKPEIVHGANAGLAGAVALLEPVKEAFPEMSYADIFQMASARSIELAGGPKIDMKYVFSEYLCCARCLWKQRCNTMKTRVV